MSIPSRCLRRRWKKTTEDNESKRKETKESDNIIFKLRLLMEPRSAGRISKRELADNP